MTENNAAQAVSEETRQAMGEALTEFMSESAEEGVFSIDPFDSRNVDELLDVVLSKLREDLMEDRAALASAPVAGNKKPIHIYQGQDSESLAQLLVDLDGLDHGTALYAAPPASEAVRDEALEEAVGVVAGEWEEGVSLLAIAKAIRARKTQVDKDGGVKS